MPPAVVEPTIPTSKRPQTHALERAATRIGPTENYTRKNTLSNLTGGIDVYPLWKSSVLSGRSICDGPIPRPEESCRACVCVSLNVFRCNNNTLQLQWVGGRGQAKEEIKKIHS